MRSFRTEFDDFFAVGLISAVEIGLGPSGELRYPSYPDRMGWRYPGIGEFQVSLNAITILRITLRAFLRAFLMCRSFLLYRIFYQPIPHILLHLLSNRPLASFLSKVLVCFHHTSTNIIVSLQCYDKYLQQNLRKAARLRGHSFWARGPDNAGQYNSRPHETGFFCERGDYDSYYGRFFLHWYAQSLIDHADNVLSLASLAFEETKLVIKVHMGVFEVALYLFAVFIMLSTGVFM